MQTFTPLLFFAAFGDYSGGLAGIECEDWNVREGIEAVHAKGGKVKVAYGGALYSMSAHVQHEWEFIKCIFQIT